MKDNRGITLIEIIVVMLIIAILGAGSIVGYNLLCVGSAKHASERILSALSYVQTQSLAKDESYSIEIFQNGEGEYVLSILSNGSSVSSEVLKLRNGQITFEDKDNPGITASVSAVIKLEVCFRKDTGGVKENSDNEMITRIGVTSSGNTCYIRLVTATGKHFIE